MKNWNNFKRPFPNLFQGKSSYPRIKSALKITCSTNVKFQWFISQFFPLHSIKFNQAIGKFTIESFKVDAVLMNAEFLTES